MKNQIENVENEIVVFFKKMHQDGLMVGSLSREDLSLFEKERREKLHPLYKKLVGLLEIEQQEFLKIRKPNLNQQMRLLGNERILRILGAYYK